MAGILIRIAEIEEEQERHRKDARRAHAAVRRLEIQKEKLEAELRGQAELPLEVVGEKASQKATKG